MVITEGKRPEAKAEASLPPLLQGFVNDVRAATATVPAGEHLANAFATKLANRTRAMRSFAAKTIEFLCDIKDPEFLACETEEAQRAYIYTLNRTGVRKKIEERLGKLYDAFHEAGSTSSVRNRSWKAFSDAHGKYVRKDFDRRVFTSIDSSDINPDYGLRASYLRGWESIPLPGLVDLPRDPILAVDPPLIDREKWANNTALAERYLITFGAFDQEDEIPEVLQKELPPYGTYFDEMQERMQGDRIYRVSDAFPSDYPRFAGEPTAIFASSAKYPGVGVCVDFAFEHSWQSRRLSTLLTEGRATPQLKLVFPTEAFFSD